MFTLNYTPVFGYVYIFIFKIATVSRDALVDKCRCITHDVCIGLECKLLIIISFPDEVGNLLKSPNSRRTVPYMRYCFTQNDYHPF